MDKVLNLTYASTLSDFREMNSSFDYAVLRIAYHGVNRNGSRISKEAFERSMHTAFNCPIVCHYSRETDELGGHDREIVHTDDGGLKIVNLTEPVGVVPESATPWWDFVEEEDGSTHEYLFMPVLLWKRQEAYDKIARDGITNQSMEINVIDATMKDNVYDILNFEFTAFTLISVEPCFEQAALMMYSKSDFKLQIQEMMQELKESFNLAKSLDGVCNMHPQNTSTEGGNDLDEKMKLAEEFGIDVDALEFSLEEKDIEELREIFTEMASTNADTDDFGLTQNIVGEIVRVLEELETVETDYGTFSRYIYADCDLDAREVYCWDTKDWLLYGFSYSVDGDSVAIDSESKKRKKYVIDDFDDGDQASPFSSVFEKMTEKISCDAKKMSEFEAMSSTLEDMTAKLNNANEEIAMLTEFKANVESEKLKQELTSVLERFSYLDGDSSFEDLKEHYTEYDAATLEEKCYAICGRAAAKKDFSVDTKVVPKLIVGANKGKTDEPYGGIFAEFDME